MSLRWEDAHSDCSRGLVRAVAPVWHAPRRSPRPPYQWRRESRRARDPDQHSGTPSIHISTQDRFEPCEADVSLRWEDAHSNRSRGLVSAVAPAWHAPGRSPRPPYQGRRGSCARAPEQHSGTPSIRMEPLLVGQPSFVLGGTALSHGSGISVAQERPKTIIALHAHAAVSRTALTRVRTSPTRLPIHIVCVPPLCERHVPLWPSQVDLFAAGGHALSA